MLNWSIDKLFQLSKCNYAFVKRFHLLTINSQKRSV